MLTMSIGQGIGPDVPEHGTFECELVGDSFLSHPSSCARPEGQWRLSLQVYERSRLRAMKKTFAGRSPNRRMKYGYHSVPKGT
jgi:hypothetical protein